MTNYEDNVEFNGAGAVELTSQQTLVATIAFAGEGALWPVSVYLPGQSELYDEAELEGEGTFQGDIANPDWGYIQPVTITNSTGGELTDFQVLVTLTAANFDYDSAKADGSDLRFADKSGLNPLPYWIESWSQHGTSYVWVKVASIPTGAITICLLYTSPSPRDRTRSRMPSSA